MIFLPMILLAQEENKAYILNFTSITFKDIKKTEPNEENIEIKIYVLFNYGTNSDAKLYYPDGSFHLFKRVSKTEDDKLDNGITFQGFKALDENGNEVLVLLYSNNVVKFIFLDEWSKPDSSITLYP